MKGDILKYWELLAIVLSFLCFGCNSTPPSKGEIVDIKLNPPGHGFLPTHARLTMQVGYKNPELRSCAITVIPLGADDKLVEVGILGIPSCDGQAGEVSIFLFTRRPVKVERFQIELFDLKEKRSFASFLLHSTIEWKDVENRHAEASIGEPAVVTKNDLDIALVNLPQTLSQARAVPYFKDGKSIGMRLFAITRGGIFDNIGLKNGDIVKSVDGKDLTDPQYSISVFERMKIDSPFELVLERNGDVVTIRYQWAGDVLSRTESVTPGAGVASPAASRAGAAKANVPPEKLETITKDELQTELANLPRLQSQARAVSYFRYGNVTGMRLFAIRSGSMWERLGFRNGDILKMVNAKVLTDPTETLTVIEQIAANESTTLILERNAVEIEFVFGWKKSVLNRDHRILSEHTVAPASNHSSIVSGYNSSVAAKGASASFDKLSTDLKELSEENSTSVRPTSR